MTQKRGRANTRSPNYPIPQAIIAIDPGHTTGMAVYCQMAGSTNIEFDHEILMVQYGPAGHRALVERLQKHSPRRNPAIIVYEKYIARPSMHGHLGGESEYQFSPIFVHGYMVGAMEECRNDEEMPTFWPQQASEMAGMPDKRLKAMFPNLYALTLKPAKPHARDALRHLLVYLKKHHKPHYDSLKPPQESAD